jgi:hypothetical protein
MKRSMSQTAARKPMAINKGGNTYYLSEHRRNNP